MNGTRTAVILLSLILLLPTFGMAQTPTLGKNIDALLQQILENQKRMQADIDMLKTQLAAKDREILTLKEQILKQKNIVDEQMQTIAARPSVAAVTQFADSYAAKVQYEVARNLEHDTIFNVRKGDQRRWFERVIGEFQKVVNNYPGTADAANAQLRIARINHRYLDNIPQAKIEYQKVIDQYPNSSNVKEAQKALAQLKGSK